MSDARQIRERMRQMALASAALVVVAAAGCQQTPNEPSMTGALDTGTYPNLNVKPGVANKQLSADDLEAARAELMSSADYNSSRNSSVPSDEDVLRWLAKRHAQDALKKIESGS